MKIMDNINGGFASCLESIFLPPSFSFVKMILNFFFFLVIFLLKNRGVAEFY